MIHSNKRKWITSYLLFAFIFTLAVYNWGISNEFKFILVASMPLMLWDICFNYRRFVMTMDKLSAFTQCVSVMYKAYTDYQRSTVYRIFVKAHCDEEDWYELDYELCLPKVCSYTAFLDFKAANDNCGKLLETMRRNKEKTASVNSFSKTIRTYNKNRFISLITILIIEGIVAFILKQ